MADAYNMELLFQPGVTYSPETFQESLQLPLAYRDRQDRMSNELEQTRIAMNNIPVPSDPSLREFYNEWKSGLEDEIDSIANNLSNKGSLDPATSDMLRSIKSSYSKEVSRNGRIGQLSRLANEEEAQRSLRMQRNLTEGYASEVGTGNIDADFREFYKGINENMERFRNDPNYQLPSLQLPYAPKRVEIESKVRENAHLIGTFSHLTKSNEYSMQYDQNSGLYQLVNRNTGVGGSSNFENIQEYKQWLDSVLDENSDVMQSALYEERGRGREITPEVIEEVRNRLYTRINHLTAAMVSKSSSADNRTSVQVVNTNPTATDTKTTKGRDGENTNLATMISFPTGDVDIDENEVRDILSDRDGKTEEWYEAEENAGTFGGLTEEEFAMEKNRAMSVREFVKTNYQNLKKDNQAHESSKKVAFNNLNSSTFRTLRQAGILTKTDLKPETFLEDLNNIIAREEKELENFSDLDIAYQELVNSDLGENLSADLINDYRLSYTDMGETTFTKDTPGTVLEKQANQLGVTTKELKSYTDKKRNLNRLRDAESEAKVETLKSATELGFEGMKSKSIFIGPSTSIESAKHFKEVNNALTITSKDNILKDIKNGNGSIDLLDGNGYLDNNSKDYEKYFGADGSNLESNIRIEGLEFQGVLDNGADVAELVLTARYKNADNNERRANIKLSMESFIDSEMGTDLTNTIMSGLDDIGKAHFQYMLDNTKAKALFVDSEEFRETGLTENQKNNIIRVKDNILTASVTSNQAYKSYIQKEYGADYENVSAANVYRNSEGYYGKNYEIDGNIVPVTADKYVTESHLVSQIRANRIGRTAGERGGGYIDRKYLENAVSDPLMQQQVYSNLYMLARELETGILQIEGVDTNNNAFLNLKSVMEGPENERIPNSAKYIAALEFYNEIYGKPILHRSKTRL